ncbi:penicillin-binding transpeptidase domain-containing protein [Streptomyces chartreusis]
MHSMIRGALGVSGVLAALAALSTGCVNGDEPADSTGKPGPKPASRPSSHRGLGEILVGDSAVTGSKATANKKVPYQRTYSDGALYASVTGYRSMLYGSAGLEAVYDDVLAVGTSGAASGDVVTTIDPAAQRAAFDALGDRQGAAVAIDAESGKLLALVSTPSYDPSAFSGQQLVDAKAWKAAQSDERSPMLNRALKQTAAPGGTFNVLVAATALEEGLYATVDETTSSPLTYVLPATVTRMTGASPQCENAPIREALRYSCVNVFTKMAADLGASRLRSMAESLGFNDETLRVPEVVSESSYPQGHITPAETALTGIGSGTVTATPLEMARVTAAVANGGRLVTTQLVERIVKADGSTEEPKVLGGQVRQVISRRTAEGLRSALRTAASDVRAQGPDGTQSETGGKTGWVTDGQGGYSTAWFTAFADGASGRPISVTVCAEGLPSSAGESNGTEQAVAVAQKILASVS